MSVRRKSKKVFRCCPIPRSFISGEKYSWSHLQARGICPRKDIKGESKEGVGKTRAEGPGSGEGRGADRRVRPSQERGTRRCSSGAPGSPYLTAHVFSPTGWHLSSRKSQGAETETTMKAWKLRQGKGPAKGM